MRLTRLRPTIAGVLQAAALVTAVFSVATFADHLHRYLELFSHFRLQYLVASILLMILLALLRSRRWAFVMLAMTIINAIPVSAWYDGVAVAGETTGATVKLLHANIYSGNRNAGPLLELIAEEEPDIVFLQEVSDRWMSALEPLRAAYGHSYRIPRDDNFGIAVLSRHPFSSTAMLESPPYGFPSLVVQQTVGNRTVTFLSTHPMPPLGQPGFDARNEQLASVAETLNSIDGPAVLIGDLNTSMWSHHYQQLIESTGLNNASYGFGLKPSWPTHLPFAMIPIDHCLVSTSIAVLDTRLGPGIGSDHLPLIVELAIP